MDIISRLKSIADESARHFGIDLVEVELRGEGRKRILRIIIDKNGGITLKDCEDVSRQIDAVLGVEDIIQGTYTLEVTSPGINRSLVNKEDFIKNKNRLINIITIERIENRENITGMLEDISDKGILIRLNDETIAIDYDNILKAKLEIEIK